MIPDPADKPTMTIAEAGAALGLGRDAAYAAAKRGEIPTLRFGRKLLVPTAALRRLVLLDEPVRDDADAAQASAAVLTLVEPSRQEGVQRVVDRTSRA